jgi:predicted MFS family arabinose efflux permease
MSRPSATIDKIALTANPFFMAGVLLLSLVPQETGQVVSPIMANIMQAFPHNSPATLSYIMTLPALATCIFAIVCGRLSVTISSKKLALFGLSAYIVGGSTCGLIENAYWMIGCRALLGIGSGFCLPLTQGLIAEYYEGAKRASMMGYAQAIGCIGGAAISLAAGYIALISWRNVFLLYLFPVVVLVMIARMLPHTKLTSPLAGMVKNSEKTLDDKRNIGLGVYVFAAVGFITMANVAGLMINLSPVIRARHLGDSSNAGIALAVMSLWSGVAAGFFGWVFKFFKEHIITMGLILFALTNIMVAKASSIFTIYAAASAWGIAAGLSLPCLGMLVSALAKDAYKSFALAILTSSLNLGVFAASLAMGILFTTLGAGNYNAYFGNTAILFAGLAVAMGIYVTGLRVSVARSLRPEGVRP